MRADEEVMHVMAVMLRCGRDINVAISMAATAIASGSTRRQLLVASDTRLATGPGRQPRL